MRILTPTALANILQLEGTEPLIVVGIEWVAGSVTYYADRELSGFATGKIISLGDLEDVVTGNSKINNLEIQLDDTNGDLKVIIDSVNIHKINVIVYQYYASWTDKFVLFQGQIQTPFSWDEKSRSIGFTVASVIESFEVGFSPEQGQLPFITDENIGKPWPLVFGSVVHSPAVKVGKSLEGYHEGILLEDLGIVDPMLQYKLNTQIEAFNQSKLLFLYWLTVIAQAGDLARKAGVILSDYVTTIIDERSIWVTIGVLLNNLDFFKAKIIKGGAVNEIQDRKNQRAAREADLARIAPIANVLALQKLRLADEIQFREFAVNLMKDGYNKAIDEYNTMRSIWVQIVAIQQEMCRQTKLVKDTILIQQGYRFPQGVAMYIFIDRARFYGSFNGDIFTIVSGPLYTYKDLAVAAWHPDTDPCAPADETNGLSVFYLADSPPANLTDMYLLVKSKSPDPRNTSNVRHLIKVVRQQGTKIIYELVGLTGADDTPGSISIDEEIGKLLAVPLVNSPFGVVPTDLLTGDWTASHWNTPQGEEILAIINSIPGGPNEEELRNIAKLVYLKTYDSFGEDLILIAPSARDSFMLIGEDVESITEAAPVPLGYWFQNYHIFLEEWPDSALWVSNSGARISTSNKDCDLHIVNILPSTILAVYAYRKTIYGTRILAPVPSSYYIKNESANLGTIDVTCLTFPLALENYGEGWEPQVYVTLTSSVGPNVCDVIQYLIETYTVGGTVNAANFTSIKNKFRSGGQELYPVAFTLQDRPNVIDEIEQIAFEARCAIYRKGDEFFLKYLAEEPDAESTAESTFTKSDIDNETHFSIAFPETSSLATRLVCTWFPDYLPPIDGLPYKLVFRHNVKLYGLHSEDITFHIYNIKSLVEKSATFWMIRKANTWKRVIFDTFLKKLELESFDTILLQLPEICNTDVKGTLISATYNPNNNSISLEVEIPVKSGTMDIYPLYWPADTDPATLFPTITEIEHGFAGGYGPANGVTGSINDCGAQA